MNLRPRAALAATALAALALSGCQGGASPSASPSGAATTPAPSAAARTPTPQPTATASATAAQSLDAAATHPDAQALTDAINAMYHAMQSTGVTLSNAQYAESEGQTSGVCMTMAKKGRGATSNGVEMRMDMTIMAKPTDDLSALCGGEKTGSMQEIVIGKDAWVTSDATTFKPAVLDDATVIASADEVGITVKKSVAAGLLNSGSLKRTGQDTYTMTLTKPTDGAAVAQLMGTGDDSDTSVLDALTGTATYTIKDGKLSSAVTDYLGTAGGVKTTIKTKVDYDYAPVTVSKPGTVADVAPVKVTSLEQLGRLAVEG